MNCAMLSLFDATMSLKLLQNALFWVTWVYQGDVTLSCKKPRTVR